MITNRTYTDLNDKETKRKIIKLLNENGYIANENDDDRTLTNVIRRFQSDKNCGFADGLIGRNTLKAMGIDIKEAEEIINPRKEREKEERLYVMYSLISSGILFTLYTFFAVLIVLLLCIGL